MTSERVSSLVMDFDDEIVNLFHEMVTEDTGEDLTNEEAIVIVGMMAGIVVGVFRRDFRFGEAKTLIDSVFRFTKFHRGLDDPEDDPAAWHYNDADMSLQEQFDLYSEHLGLLRFEADKLACQKNRDSNRLRRGYLRRIQRRNQYASVPGSDQDTLDIEKDFDPFLD